MKKKIDIRKLMMNVFVCQLMLSLLIPFCSFSQDHSIDSLKLLIKNEIEDTNKVNNLNQLSKNYISISNFDSAIIIGNQELELAKKLNFKQGISPALTNIGISYHNFGNFPKALEYYLQGLKLDEEQGNKVRIGKLLSNIAAVYKNEGEFKKAEDNNYKALAIFEELHNAKGIAAVCNNLGSIYNEQLKYDSALVYYRRALRLDESSGNKSIQSMRYGTLGVVYQETGRIDSAEFYYQIALKCADESGNKAEKARYLCNLGSIYIIQKKYAQAESFILQSLKIFEETNYLEGLRESHNQLYQLYKLTGDFKKALIQFKLFSLAKDSLYSQDKNEEIVRQELNYEFDKKETAIKAEQEKKEAVNASEKKRQNIFFWLICSVAIAIGLTALIIFRTLRLTRSRKEIIEFQKSIVEEKQKEVLDSIHYAKRIQQSLLPTEKYIQRSLERLKKK